MAKKGKFVKAVSFAAAGAGAAVLVKKTMANKKEEKKDRSKNSDYRNTERGMHGKIKKGFIIPMEIMKPLPVPKKPLKV